VAAGPGRPERKLLSLDDLTARREEARAAGRVFVLTNGCFDVLHRGHVELLAAARAEGDELAVALNDDDSVRRLKGPDRPLVPAGDRALVLAALEAVSWVTLFSEDTPIEVIRRAKPDVLVKGGDYRPEEVVGRKEVEASGGRLVLFPLVAGRSTSALVDRMRGKA
jgi:D-beta-D-heptose 7-phosphate kinase/D-beta-D-heptose 1-phosphate adenosyltransferase